MYVDVAMHYYVMMTIVTMHTRACSFSVLRGIVFKSTIKSL